MIINTRTHMAHTGSFLLDLKTGVIIHKTKDAFIKLSSGFEGIAYDGKELKVPVSMLDFIKPKIKFIYTTVEDLVLDRLGLTTELELAKVRLFLIREQFKRPIQRVTRQRLRNEVLLIYKHIEQLEEFIKQGE